MTKQSFHEFLALGEDAGQAGQLGTGERHRLRAEGPVAFLPDP